MKRPNWKHIRRYAFFAAALAIPGAKEMGLIAAPVALGAEASVKLVEFISGQSEGAIPECLAPAVALHTAPKELRLREAPPTPRDPGLYSARSGGCLNTV